MAYDFENRLVFHEEGDQLTTFVYSGDGLKVKEVLNGQATTVVWDGQQYLEEHS